MESHSRQAEADALGISLKDLITLEQNRDDERRAEQLGMEIWELRMRNAGATDGEIEAHRVKLQQEMKRVLRL